MCEINGFLIPAIIDTGAEITVMSASCAKRCQISSYIDSRYAGKAIGVGSSEIIGGIEDLSFRLGPISFQNKISILRSSRCDFLIGLDILRRFQCDISLGQKTIKLKVRNNTIRLPLLTNQNIISSNFEQEINIEESKDILTEQQFLKSNEETSKEFQLSSSFNNNHHHHQNNEYDDYDNNFEESFDSNDVNVSMAGV